MADLELSFTLKDGKRFKEGVFYIDGLTIIDTDGNYEINYDDIELELDGKPYDGTLEVWRGYLSTEDIFDQVLSGYLMNDGTYTSFSEDWSAFTDLENLKEYQGDLLIKLPVFRIDEVVIYELDLATPDHRYYIADDEVMMLDSDNEIVTDMENFYMEAIEEDITDILRGDLECLYMGYNVKQYIEEVGGEEAWLEQYEE